MKKFLSLVLALIMTMSLVTISAGATEYKDLTDKDEIQYEEAVAVLNRIGIITGYDDGTFRPETELTRGAAAKIIVSLMIGPEAASALPNTYSPYPDVPAGHTFAGVISYCKTAGYISGYGDGTFKPANSLTGFAFAKMLLGALGYKSDLEGFTGTGWTMNVAKLGNAAGLFNRLSFNGAEAVNREEACQLALNTLKATMVEYTGGFNIVSGDATIVGNQVRTYITSNQDYAAHINNKKVSDAGNANVNNHYTVEFGEEHFKDLRMQRERSTVDDFGRPSNEWSYKKVTIGTFPVEADFVYTTQVTAVNDIKVTKATKIRDLGLNGYEVDGGTILKVNGKTESVFTDDNNIEKIADYTDNGTVVEVYVSEDDADYVENVVVVKTQLMEVKKLGSDYVTLDKEDDCDENEKTGGFNQLAISEKVDDVEVEDAYYDFLKGLKAGDKVAVIPVTVDEGESYTVAKAYTPETVSGSLDGSRSFTNAAVVDSDRSVIEVTVGGTAYKVATWNKDLQSANRDIIKVTKKDVTLLLDEFGNALLAKDIGSTSDYMILGAWRNSMVDGVLVRMATGWDVKGNAISLNVGSEKSLAVSNYNNFYPGDVLRYTNDGASGNAEWKLSKAGVYLVPGNEKVTSRDSFAIKASNSAVTLDKDQYELTDNKVVTASGIKTIYVSFDDEKEVDYIEIKDGLQNISQNELDYKGITKLTFDQAEATISKLSGSSATEKSEVTYVVVKKESNDATLKNLGFIWKNDNTTNNKDENGDVLTKYNVFTVDDDNVSMTASKSIPNFRFVRFKALDEEAGRYDLKNYDYRQRSTSVAKVIATEVKSPNSNNLIRLKDGYRNMAGDKLPLTNDPLPNIQTNKAGFGTDLTVGDKYENLINIKGAKFLDLYRGSIKIDDADDLKEALKSYDVEMSIAFNDNPDNDEFRKAYIVVITNLTKKDATVDPEPTTGAVKFDSSLSSKDGKIAAGSKVEVLGSGKTYATFTLEKPDWAYYKQTSTDGDNVEVEYELYVDGVKWGKQASTLNLKDKASAGSGDLVPTKGSDAKSASFEVKELDLTAAGSILTAANAANKTVTMVITKVDWKNANIQYVDNSGKALNMVGLGTTTDDHIAMGSAATIDFQVAAATMGGKYTISGIKTDSLDVDEYTDVAETDFTAATVTTASVEPEGGEFVTVTITPENKFAEKYNLTVNNDGIKSSTDTNKLGTKVTLNGYFGMPKKTLDTGKNFDDLKVETSIDGGTTTDNSAKQVDAGEGFDVKVTLTTAAANGTKTVKEYKVTLKGITGATIVGNATKTVDPNSSATFTFDKMSADIEITADNIAVEPVYMLHAEAVEFDGRKATVTFSEKDLFVLSDTDLAATDIDLTDKDDTNRFADLESCEIVGNTIVMILKSGESFADGDKIKIGEDKFDTTDDGAGENLATTFVISVKDGAISQKSVEHTHS